MKLKRTIVPSIYFQYFISYLVVLFIPLFIIGMLVFSHIVGTYQKQALDVNEQMLEQVGELVDTKFKEIGNIATDMSTNPLASLNDFGDPLHYYKLRHVMNYQLSNTFLNQVFLYDREKEHFYTSNSSYSLAIFNHIYPYKDWSPIAMKETLDTLKSPLLRKAELIQNENYITYLRPIPLYSFNPRGTAIFMIKEQVLKDILRSVLLYKGNEAFIIDSEGMIITGVYDQTEISSAAILEKVDTTKNSRETLQIERSGSPVFVSYIHSVKTDFTYVVVTPKEELLKDVKQIRNVALQALALILLIGGGAIYFSMRYNYNPIRRIMVHVEKTWVDSSKEKGFKKIESALSAAVMWNQQVVSSAPYVRQQLLNNLLQGRIMDKEELNHEGQNVGLVLTHTHYFIAIIKSEMDFPNELDAPFKQLELEEAEDQILMLKTDMGLTLIISADQANAIPRNKLTLIQKQLTEAMQNVVTIGVGSIYENINQLNQSYIEASTALQHEFIYGSGKVIYFEELDQKLSLKIWSTQPLTETLLMHLERGSSEQAMITVNNLAAGIREKSHSLFQAKSNCLEVINAVLHFLQERYKKGEQAGNLVYPDIISYANFSSIERLLEVMTDVCLMACEMMESHTLTEEKGINSNERIKAYILNHYMDYHFSLQSMAYDLKLSVSSVSRSFKLSSGNTIMEYVNELRIAKAKELLQTTILPVKEIVELIGYKDVSSFIRKFKQQLGMTPIEYRTHHNNKKDK